MKIGIKKESKKFQKYKFKNFEDKAKSQIGDKLYKAFIRGYTIKQWGKSPKLLPESIFNRLPIRFSYNEDYYPQTQFQGIPLKGYTEIFKNLLDNKNIRRISLFLFILSYYLFIWPLTHINNSITREKYENYTNSISVVFYVFYG